MTSKPSIFVIVAHSDDQILGPGGTLARYVKEGYDVYTVIFSYGEKSHPHFKKDIIASIRAKEAYKADKIIGGRGVTFLGLDELKFSEQFPDSQARELLTELLLTKRPKKIFTHSEFESHPDHKAVHAGVLELYDTLHQTNKFTTDIYTFKLYGLKIKRYLRPKLVVDISSTFSIKRKAIGVFSSQKVTMVWLPWLTHFYAFMSGLRYGCKFAEEFFKVR